MEDTKLSNINNGISVKLNTGASKEDLQLALQSALTAKVSAQESAANAATSEANASTSATNSANSATSASGSASTATTQAGIATTKATEASTSASNASTSESNASASETAAATSETNAAISASSASSSATASATSAANAATSESNAATSETNASFSATAAATSATNAANTAATVEAIYDSADASAVIRNSVSSSGYLTKVKQEDRWLETDTPNVIVDKVGDDYVIDGVVYSQLGDELVTNGDFSDGTTGWVSYGGATLSNDNGRVKVVDIDIGGAYQILTTEIGKTYIVEGTIFADYSSSINIYTSNAFSTNVAQSSYIVGVNGRITYTFVATTTTSTILLRNAKTGTYYYDNISVRELKQATLPEAPFASTSTDELLDDKVNGLTTQSAHSKGDIVVTGNELVTNGTFDSDTSGWIAGVNATISLSSNKFRVTNATTNLYGIATNTGYECSTVVGKTYILSLEYTNISSSFRVDVTGTSALIAGSTTGVYTKQFTATSTATLIGLVTTTVGLNNYAEFDNISVTLKDKIYQATEDTTTGTLLSDTSKFQKLDFVSRQDLIYLTATGYKTKKGIHNFLDTELVEGGSDLIASRYGYSKLGNGLYEIDGEKVTNLQVTGSRLNGGVWHPMFNKFGVARPVRGDYAIPAHITVASLSFWYHATGNTSSNKVIDLLSVYDCLNPIGINIGYWDGSLDDSIGTSSVGRPDSKFYDKIYLKGENGLASHSLFYAKDDYELPRDTFGIETDDSTTYAEKLITETITTASSTLKTLTLGKAKTVHKVLYSTDSGETWATQSVTFDSVNNQITLDTARDYILVSYTAYNKPYVQLDPQKITKVTPKSIATNSHSVYKDSLITWLATGKIATGNGSNGYESKYLENSIIDPEDNTTLAMTPQHSTHQLDNSNSSACKYFEVEFEFTDGSKGEGIVTQELIFNITDSDYGDDTGDYGKLTNGTDTDLNGNTIKTGFYGRRK